MRHYQPGSLLDLKEVQASRLLKAGVAVPTRSNVWQENGRLRTRGYIPDLALEICRLTEDDLALQKALLLRHCEGYDRHHFWRLVEEWDERAAIMQHDGGMAKEAAELEAARLLHLEAFLEDLRGDRVQAA